LLQAGQSLERKREQEERSKVGHMDYLKTQLILHG
jgi:hypothetical protein